MIGCDEMPKRLPKTDFHGPSVPPADRFGVVETRRLADPEAWHAAWLTAGRDHRRLRVEPDGRVTVLGADPAGYRMALEQAGGDHDRLRVDGDGRVTVLNRRPDGALVPSPFAK